jgi:alpha-L-rhamnosidase
MKYSLSLFFLFSCLSAFAVTPYSLHCESLPNPIGIDIPQPELGWKLQSDEQNQWQSAYEIRVALSEKDLEKDANLVWKTGKVLSNQSFHISYKGKKLKSFTRYWWKVRVYDKAGKMSDWSPAAYWETAMLSPTDWKAGWISDGKPQPVRDEDFYKDDPMPLFRKEFTVKKKPVSARLYISGLGYYEAYVNGEKMGDNVLDPGWTAYGKQTLYSVYEVSPVVEGQNVIGILSGNGWYNPLPFKMWGKFNLREGLSTVGRPCVKAELHLRFADGSKEIIATDETWQTAPGPVVRNSVYLGEHYDARLEQEAFAKPVNALPDGWKNAVKTNGPAGQLTAQMQPPIRMTKILKPVRMTESRAGVFIFDFGQNMAGVVRLKIQGTEGTEGTKGTKITVRYGEDVFSDGSLNGMTSVAGQLKKVWDADWSAAGQPPIAWQEDSYILKGQGEEVWSPRFTFHGFRYVEISGWPGRPTLENIEALRMNADLSCAGQFESANPMLNQLNTVVDYTFLSNVFSVQSDCPAREKFGYGGDIVATARSFCWFYDMGNFYRKTIRDFANDQRPLGGMTESAPNQAIDDQGLGDGSGPIGWQLAFAYLQKQLYEYYGDTREIQKFYPVLLKQVEFLRSQAQDNFIDRCINDHESLEKRIPALFATAHYYHHVALLAEFATLTNHVADAQKYTQLAEEIKQSFISRFVTSGKGEVGNHTQAAQAFGLFYDFLPENERAAAFQVLLQEIEKRDGHIAAGLFGVPLVLDALVQNGRNDVAYNMVTKMDFPGWGHMLQSGATTVWETWKYSDNVYSHNHPMFGSVGEWFYQGILGIRQGAPGFRKIIFKPQPPEGLAWAKGSYETLYGTVVSSWKQDEKGFNYDITVPVGATAEVWMPSGNDYTVHEVGSGEYHFEQAAEGVSHILPEKNKINLFPLSDIRITGGQFKDIQDLDYHYLLTLEPDRMLSWFRREAGLTPKAQPYPFWESEDVWGAGPLPGHILGFYLSSMSMMYQTTQDEKIIEKLRYTLQEMKTCQDAQGDGFLSAVINGRKVFESVVRDTAFRVSNPLINGTWEPVYIMNKIMLGLQNVYTLCGLNDAKPILIGMADWFGHSVLDKLSDRTIQKLLICEHGSINESFLDVYALTGDKKYLNWAGKLNDEQMWIPLSQGKDILNGWHANTQIPKFTGFNRYYQFTGKPEFYNAANLFWDIVVAKHTWVNGGNSLGEHFFEESLFEKKVTEKGGPESCNSVNMMRLTESLYQTDAKPERIDYYEQVLYNHILANYDPEEGMCVYFTSMRPGHYRIHGTQHESFWCCTGTGFEAPAKFAKMIYAHNDQSLYVNLFIPSELHWKEKGIRLEQITRFPDENQSKLRIHTAKSVLFNLHIRKPYWIEQGKFTVKVNGKNVQTTESDGYIIISRIWSNNDKVAVSFSPRLEIAPLKDSKTYYSVVYGPIVLGAKVDNHTLDKSSFRQARKTVADVMIPVEEAPALFGTPETIKKDTKRIKANELRFCYAPKGVEETTLIPFNRIHFSRYALYFIRKDN